MALYDKKYQNFRLLTFPESFLFSNKFHYLYLKELNSIMNPFDPFISSDYHNSFKDDTPL